MIIKVIFLTIVILSSAFSETATGPCSDPVCDSINWVIIKRKLGSHYADSGYILQGKRVTEIGGTCRLDTFPEEVGNLTDVSYFTALNGTMKYLPTSIGNLTKLQFLDVSNNQLKELPPTIGRLINLRELYLQRNNLTTLPDSIVNITRLDRYLDLPGYKCDINWNHICSLPPEVSKWVDITYSGGAYSGENYEIYDKKGSWKIAQCNDCPNGHMTCNTSIDARINKPAPQLQPLPASGVLFNLHGKKLNLSEHGNARNSLPKGCYIIKYGTATPYFRRYVVP